MIVNHPLYEKAVKTLSEMSQEQLLENLRAYGIEFTLVEEDKVDMSIEFANK